MVKKEPGFPFLPLMDSTSLVSQGHGDCPVFTEVEVVAIVMIVGGNPSNPHASRVLTSKDPYRVVVLKSDVQDLASIQNVALKSIKKKRKN